MSTEQNTPSDLLALSEKATPGPWEMYGGTNHGRVQTADVVVCDGSAPNFMQPEDAKFIAALVNWFRSQDWDRPSLSAQAVGDGWVLVPREPTGDMLRWIWGSGADSCRNNYASMLQDAPKATPPQPADGGDRVGELVELLLTLRDKFQDINLDDDGDNYMNDSCDGMDLIDAALAKFQPAGGES